MLDYGKKMPPPFPEIAASMTPQQYNSSNNPRKKNAKTENPKLYPPTSPLRVHTASSSDTQTMLLYEVTTTAAVHDEVYVHQQHTTALLYATYSTSKETKR